MILLHLCVSSIFLCVLFRPHINPDQDPPKEVFLGKRRPAWARELMQEVEKYGAPDGTFRESRRPKSFSSYVALLLDIIDAEPTCYEEAVKK